MPTLWHYARDEKKLGPFSQRQLKELAAAGTILPTDMVWLEGVEQGVLANRVKNLFPPTAANTLQAIDAALLAEAAASPQDESTPPAPSLVPLEKSETRKPQPKEPERPARKGRATALKGCDIVGQDGAYARYRKKCIECGHKDSACHTIPISNRLLKENFFCPKCRKRREVAIQCQL